MDFAFNDEQEMIRTPAADFLKNECPADLVRELMESGHGHSEDLWEKIIELGWSALPFPAEYGGLDLTFVDLAIILEEMGKVLLPGTYFSTVVLGGLTLLASGSEEQKRQWLEPLAEGSLKATLAVAEPAGRIDAAGVTLKADRQGDSYSLSGTKLFVPDAHTADLIICAARTGDSADPSQGISLLAVDRDSVGLGVKPLQTLDQTRRLYEVTFDGVQLTESRILGEAGQAWAVLETVLDKAAIGLSAEMVGGAQRMLDLSVAYSKERVQFGRPIGSFPGHPAQVCRHAHLHGGRPIGCLCSRLGCQSGKRGSGCADVDRQSLHQRRLPVRRRRRYPDPRGHGVYLGRRPPSVPETSQVSRSRIGRRHLPPGTNRYSDRALAGLQASSARQKGEVRLESGIWNLPQLRSLDFQPGLL